MEPWHPGEGLCRQGSCCFKAMRIEMVRGLITGGFAKLTSSKGLLMVVSKRWFEFCGGTKFRYPLFTSI